MEIIRRRPTNRKNDSSMIFAIYGRKLYYGDHVGRIFEKLQMLSLNGSIRTYLSNSFDGTFGTFDVKKKIEKAKVKEEKARELAWVRSNDEDVHDVGRVRFDLSLPVVLSVDESSKIFTR